MTFKDLKKKVVLQAAEESKAFDRLHDKPFWTWDTNIRTNGFCCFNHIIGLPQKDGNDKPLYD